MMEAIIFGVDGVLAETHELRRRAFNRAFADGCMEWRWGRTLYAELLKMRGGPAILDDFIASRFPHWKRTEDLEKLVTAINRRQRSIARQMLECGAIAIRPGIAEFMQVAAASGVRLAIATEENETEVAGLLKSSFGNSKEGPFEVVVAGGSDRETHSAHDRVLEVLPVDASACLAVESSPAGVRSATRAGIPTVIACGIYQQLPDCCDLLATDARASSTVFSRWDAVEPQQMLAELRMAHIARTAANDARSKPKTPRPQEKEIAHARG